MKRIAIDMDEVLADTSAKFLRVCNAEFQLSLTKSQLAGKNVWDAIGREHFPRLREIVFQPDFFLDLAVMPDSQDVVRQLSGRYEVFVSSSAMEVPPSFTAKFQWLAQNFPFIPPERIVFCGDKSILDADYLIDDNARHFQRFRGEGILFSAPHNAGIEGYRRVDSWRDVAALLLT